MMDDRGAFSIDFVAAYTVLAILALCAIFTATNMVSVRFTNSYAGDITPLAENIGDTLLRSTGEPVNWYLDPGTARSATSIGLSGGNPNIILAEKLQGLSFYNPQALSSLLGVTNNSSDYGVRLEIVSNDGTVSAAAGYQLSPDTVQVGKTVRIAAIEYPDGTYKDATMTVYLWRNSVGTALSDE